MVLNSKGIAVRNPNAKHMYNVQMRYGKSVYWVQVPADDEREAHIVAENETPGVWTGKTEMFAEKEKTI